MPGTIITVLGIFPHLLHLNFLEVGELSLPISWRGHQGTESLVSHSPEGAQEGGEGAGILAQTAWLENHPAYTLHSPASDVVGKRLQVENWGEGQTKVLFRIDPASHSTFNCGV